MVSHGTNADKLGRKDFGTTDVGDPKTGKESPIRVIYRAVIDRPWYWEFFTFMAGLRGL